jgi:hypothetical protein
MPLEALEEVLYVEAEDDNYGHREVDKGREYIYTE